MSVRAPTAQLPAQCSKVKSTTSTGAARDTLVPLIACHERSCMPLRNSQRWMLSWWTSFCIFIVILGLLSITRTIRSLSNYTLRCASEVQSFSSSMEHLHLLHPSPTQLRGPFVQGCHASLFASDWAPGSLLGLRLGVEALWWPGECDHGWEAHLQCADQDVAPLQVTCRCRVQGMLHAHVPGSPNPGFDTFAQATRLI